jgi:hypothetical protein
MKKIFLLTLISGLLLAGCGSKDLAMDQLAEDGKYHYHNKRLGFAINLPSEFQYYQTQRKNTDYYIDIEFFVPTSDEAYPQEVPGYAKSILVRIMSDYSWGSVEDNEEYRSIFQKVGEKGDKVYTIVFWDKIPTDWQDKWEEKLKVEIIKSFTVN